MTTQDTPENTTPSESHTVLFEFWNDNSMTWEDDTFVAYPSEQEAVDAFIRAWGDDPQLVRNPRVVKMGRYLPGKWGDEACKP